MRSDRVLPFDWWSRHTECVSYRKGPLAAKGEREREREKREGKRVMDTEWQQAAKEEAAEVGRKERTATATCASLSLCSSLAQEECVSHWLYLTDCGLSGNEASRHNVTVTLQSFSAQGRGGPREEVGRTRLDQLSRRMAQVGQQYFSAVVQCC